MDDLNLNIEEVYHVTISFTCSGGSIDTFYYDFPEFGFKPDVCIVREVMWNGRFVPIQPNIHITAEFAQGAVIACLCPTSSGAATPWYTDNISNPQTLIKIGNWNGGMCKFQTMKYPAVTVTNNGLLSDLVAYGPLNIQTNICFGMDFIKYK